MSKKSDLLNRLLKEVKPRWSYPATPSKDLTLIEHAIVLVLMRHMTQTQAEASLKALRKGYEDWNETRVAQVQEVASYFQSHAKKKGLEHTQANVPAARALREFLQEVFQKTHGLDLDFLRDDPVAAGKLIAQMPVMGITTGGYLMWIAGDGDLPVHPTVVKILDRLGFVARTASMKKARASMEPLVPAGKTREFAIMVHEIAERWNDPDKPIYVEVATLRETAFGKKAHEERIAQQARLEAQQKRDRERRIAQEKKDAERERREEERERKRQDAENKRKQRELEKRRKIEAKKRAIEQKKVEAAKAKVAAAKKKIADAARAKKQAAAAKKKAAIAKKKAAAKKKADAAKKKADAAKKKAASRKKAPARKKSAASKPMRSRAAAKKKVAKKKVTKKPAKKKVTKKKVAKKKVTKKKVTKKKVTKKPAAKKKVTKKKVARKKTRRR